MNKHVKNFLLRGLLFGGFGPIVLGIVYFILSCTVEGFFLNGAEVLLGIVSTYLLAFVQAGATIFNQIEGWPIAKSLGFHLLTIYVAYILCYLVNTWIPFDPIVIVIFTSIFLVTFLAIWLTVYLIVKNTSKRFNKLLK